MKKTIKSGLNSFSAMIPLSLYLRIMPRDVIDYFWHIVSDDPMPHVQHLYPVVPTADFESALLYLKTNYTFVTYEQLHSCIFEGARLPSNAVHISFDDGYVECFNVVRPLLLKHKIPCTFFLTTNLIDNHILFYRNKQSLCVNRINQPDFEYNPSIFKSISYPVSKPPSSQSEFTAWLKDLRLPQEPLIDEICHALDVDWQSFLVSNQPYLTTKQIQQLHADGFTIGAHTMSHQKLVDLPNHEIEQEISQSCHNIKQITGQVIVPFSFPHSAYGLDRDHLAGIRKRHSNIGLLFDTKGIRRDVAFIHNRIWAERPLTVTDKSAISWGAQGIKDQTRFAYQEAWVDRLLEKGRQIA